MLSSPIRRFLHGMTGAIGTVAVVAMLCVSAPAGASFIGDLVYCDVDANGVYDEYDWPLSDVAVHVTCTANDATSEGEVIVANDATVCYDAAFMTGADPSAVPNLGLFPEICGDPANPPSHATWNPSTEGAQPGRYLHEVWTACDGYPGPWTCSVSVDFETLPLDCDEVVTPMLDGPPYPDLATGNFCEDGPFPEGQPLGNKEDCLNYPDLAPANELFTVIVDPIDTDECNIHNDFGYTSAAGFDGCTPGFWKQRHHFEYWPIDPETSFNAIFQCDPALFDPEITLGEALRLKGGRLNKVGRHGTAAYLNWLTSGVDFPLSFEEIQLAVCAGDVDFLVPYNELSDECPAKEDSGDDPGNDPGF